MDSALISAEKIKPLFEAGLHLGHKKNRLHPKAKKYVYTIQNGVTIIDLTITAKQLENAKNFLQKCFKEDKKLLVVATKKVASKFTFELCREKNIPHITTKWLPGLLTNFDTIIKNVKRLTELKHARDEGEWNSLIKHERVKHNKQVVRLEKFYGGIVNLTKKPDVLFIVDIRKEKNAVSEAIKSRIPVVAIVDTNSNPFDVEYPIVANDDSPTSVQFLIHELLENYQIKDKKPAKIKK